MDSLRVDMGLPNNDCSPAQESFDMIQYVHSPPKRNDDQNKSDEMQHHKVDCLNLTPLIDEVSKSICIVQKVL